MAGGEPHESSCTCSSSGWQALCRQRKVSYRRPAPGHIRMGASLWHQSCLSRFPRVHHGAAQLSRVSYRPPAPSRPIVSRLLPVAHMLLSLQQKKKRRHVSETIGEALNGTGFELTEPCPVVIQIAPKGCGFSLGAVRVGRMVRLQKIQWFHLLVLCHVQLHQRVPESLFFSRTRPLNRDLTADGFLVEQDHRSGK